MTSDKLNTRIDGIKGSFVFVDKLDEETVWLSANVRDGGVRITMTMDQAKDMIAALIRVVEAE